MPTPASALKENVHLRVLLMGYPKVGKTTSTISSLAETCGPGYVIECGPEEFLVPAQRRTDQFEFDVVRDEVDMDAAVKCARKGTKEGKYKWVVVDDLTLYASFLEKALADRTRNEQGEADGRRFWPEYHTRLGNVIARLFECEAHVVAICHYIEQTGEMDGQHPKSGTGYVPNFAGKSRAEVPARFQDVLFMAKNRAGERVFQLNPEGVWGPGSRSVDGTKEIPASFGLLLEEIKKGRTP